MRTEKETLERMKKFLEFVDNIKTVISIISMTISVPLILIGYFGISISLGVDIALIIGGTTTLTTQELALINLIAIIASAITIHVITKSSK